MLDQHTQSANRARLQERENKEAAGCFALPIHPPEVTPGYFASTCEDYSNRGNACEAGTRWPDDVRPCRRLNLHDRRADLDCITVNMLPAISVFCDLRQMCYCVMLSRLFVDIGQIRWIHELHALYMSGCILQYVQSRLIATSSLRLVWLRSL